MVYLLIRYMDSILYTVVFLFYTAANYSYLNFGLIPYINFYIIYLVALFLVFENLLKFLLDKKISEPILRLLNIIETGAIILVFSINRFSENYYFYIFLIALFTVSKGLKMGLLAAVFFTLFYTLDIYDIIFSNVGVFSIMPYIIKLLFLPLSCITIGMILKYKEDKAFRKNVKTYIENLERTNEKLNKIVAEFYTLSHISNIINSTLDVKELLKMTNDIIIGITGVRYCTIFIWDESGKAVLEVTNIKEEDKLKEIGSIEIYKKDFEIIIKQKGYVDYRDLKSGEEAEASNVLCIPIKDDKDSYGFIIAEHDKFNVFNEDIVKYLGVIVEQITIALNNAKLYAMIRDMATVDCLTKAYTRAHFDKIFAETLEISKKMGRSLGIIMFDIDDFKLINDTYGHVFGDKVLSSIISIIKNNLRPTDILGRYGGEEFVILLPNSDFENTRLVAERIRNLVATFRIYKDIYPVGVTISVGFSVYPDCGENMSQLIEAADNALYKSKKKGKNSITAAVCPNAGREA